MIRSFSVENYRSIRDKQSISFESTSEKDQLDLIAVEVKPGCYINKLGLFYGANASGKSNILFALEAVFELLIYFHGKKEKTIHCYEPFALTPDKPTNLKVDFFANGIEYVYEICYNQTTIISELLTYYPANRSALFYRREYAGENKQPAIEFGSTLKLSGKTKQSLIEATFNNHSLLSTIGKLSLKDDAKPFYDLYNNIVNNIHNVNGDKIYSSLKKELKAVCEDQSKKEFYIRLLSKADFNITNFSVEKLKQNVSAETDIFSSERDLNELLIKSNYDISFTNHASDGDFNVKQRFQSDGTLRFIELLNALYDMVSDSHTYFFDELGNRMHYDLLLFYLTIFLYNSDDSQLLFSTHSIMLLDEDFVRRDMIYLTEKDRQSASTAYVRVSELGLHKNLSLFNAYRQGKLGAGLKSALHTSISNIEKALTMANIRETIAVIGEGLTEKRHIMSVLDTVVIKPKPVCPKNTSIKELKNTIETCIKNGFSKIICLIDMDNKAADGTQRSNATYRKEYLDLKQKYHEKIHKNKHGEQSPVIMLESYPSSELFFLYYLRYTTAHCTNAGLKSILNRMFGYETTEKYLTRNSLHDVLTEIGGNLHQAISNSRTSIVNHDHEDPHSVFTEIGLMFDHLKLI